MQVYQQGDFVTVSRITGPKHNLLQLMITTTPTAYPICECLPTQGQCKHPPLDEQALTEAVMAGVADANQQLGTDYYAAHIKYVANDTKPEVVYHLLAQTAVKFVVNKPSNHSD